MLGFAILHLRFGSGCLGDICWALIGLNVINNIRLSLYAEHCAFQVRE